MLFWVLLVVSVSPGTGDVSQICKPDGPETAKHVVSMYNSSANPCDQFRRYACGQWMDSHPIPAGRINYDTLGEVGDRVQERIKILLESNAVTVDVNPEVVKMTRQFYQKCLLAETNTIVDHDLAQIVSKMPLFNAATKETFDTNWLAQVAKQFAKNPLFSVFVTTDDRNNSNYMFVFDEASLFWSSVEYYSNANHMDAYQRYITKALEAVKGVLNFPINVNQSINEMIDLERKLAKMQLSKIEKKDPIKLYNKMSIAELQLLIPKIDLIAYLKIVVPDAVAKHVCKKKNVLVRAPDYFKKLNTLLETTDTKQLLNYNYFAVINRHLGLLGQKFADIYQVFQSNHNNTNSTNPLNKTKTERYKTCVDATMSTLSVAVGSIYSNRHFGPLAKAEVREIVDNLKAAAVDLITNLDWMDKTTKSAAVEKINAMIPHLGYPEYLKNSNELSTFYSGLDPKYFSENSSVSFYKLLVHIYKWGMEKNFLKLLTLSDRSRNDFNAADTNAFYYPTQNAIVFPAAILQPPFFKRSYPKFVNYGAIGMIIGHEITHAFDSHGSQYDKFGNLNRWWTDGAAEQFRLKVKCVVDQYSNYTVVRTNFTVNGNLTKSENLADQGGVKIAWKAYEKYVAKAGVEPMLPGLSLTNQQAFFVSVATFLCENAMRSAIREQILTDYHSPSGIRALGALSSFPTFAEAFKCQPNDKYNPTKRCQVW